MVKLSEPKATFKWHWWDWVAGNGDDDREETDLQRDENDRVQLLQRHEREPSRKFKRDPDGAKSILLTLETPENTKALSNFTPAYT